MEKISYEFGEDTKNISFDFGEDIKNISFDFGEDTYYINLKQKRKEYLYSYLSVTSYGNNTKDITFYSNPHSKNILNYLQGMRFKENISHYIISLKDFPGEELILNLKSFFNLSYIKYHNIGFFWYVLILNDGNNSILEENLVDLDNVSEYKIDLLKYTEIQFNLYDQKKRLENNIKKLESECKEITIDKLLNLKTAIDHDYNKLLTREDEIKTKYDRVEDKIKLIAKKKIDKKLLKEQKEIESVKVEKTEERNLAVLVHLYYIDIWEDIKKYLKILYDSKVNFDLYVNISVNEKKDIENPEYINLIDNINRLSIYNSVTITYSKNIGLDLGGFIKSYLKILELNLKYKHIIKIHSKQNTNWRFCMLYCLLGSDKIIKTNFKLLENSKLGLIGSNKIRLTKEELVENVFNLQNVDNKINEYIQGGIFWIKGEILDYYFSKEKLESMYRDEKKMLKLEKVFGMLVSNYGMFTHSYT